MSIEHHHYKLYKPFGMLSQFHSNTAKESRKKRFLGELFDFPKNVMPIGRLDEKSEGLLLLTTSGKLSNYVNQSGIEKEYYAQLDGSITPIAIAQLQEGVHIGLNGEKYATKAYDVGLLETIPAFTPANKSLRIGRHRPSSWIRITILEGKFRQVRKMTAAVGFPTLRLVRVRIGSHTLEGLFPGDVVPAYL